MTFLSPDDMAARRGKERGAEHKALEAPFPSVEGQSWPLLLLA